MERKVKTNAKGNRRNRSKGTQSFNNDSETRLERDLMPEPPTRNLIRTDTQVRRFVQGGAVTNQAFSLSQGHDQFLVVTGVAGQALCYVDSWRIKYIDVWAVAGSDGSATSVSLTPVGTDSSNMNNDPEQLFQMSARSFTEPVHMRVRPSKFRPFGSWHFTNTTGVGSALFQINVVGNGGASNTRVTMDITFETRVNLAGLPLGYTTVTSTVTLGTLGARSILSAMNVSGINNLG
jgi:hypothetical protein